MRTVDIPAEIYDTTLAWCNARRRENDLPPWDALPPGKPRNTHDCPCASSVPGLRVLATTWHYAMSATRGNALDDMLLRFIALFDAAGFSPAPDKQLVLPVRVP